MNLREEKSRLRKMRILLALNLSEKNEKLAKEYLDTTQPENEKLLEEVEHESFTFESNRKILECSLELEVIVKSNDTEYMKRYARFVTAVGGSTAFYVLHKEGRYILINRNYFSEYLTLEQVSAIEAEQLNYKIYGRYSFVTEKINEKNPVILKNAMHFCYEDSVGKLFLAAISLFYTKPIQAENKNDVICEVEQQEKESSLIVETLTQNIQLEEHEFNRRKTNILCYQEEKDIQELVTYMIHSFIQVLPKMPQNGTFSEEELDILKQFIEESEENAELSKSVEVILQGKKYNDEFIDLIASCAFLAIEHSYQFLNCLKLTMLMDLENEISTTWSACFWVHDPEWFEKHCILLEEAFPEKVRLRMDLYIVWCMKYKQYSIIERLSAHYPEKMKEALMKNEKQDVVQFLKVIKKGNPKFYETIKDSFEIEYQRKLVHELVKNCGTGKELLEQYLLGEAKADVLYPFLKEWREHAWSVMAGTWQTMDLLKKLPDKQVLRRIAVFTGLILYTSFFSFDMGCLVSRSKVGITYEDKQVLEELISIFAEEEIPFLYQLELFGQLREIGSYEYKFGAEKKDKFFKNYRKLMKDNQDWKDAAAIGAKEANPQGRCFCIRILHQFGQEYKDVLLDCAKDSSKQVKQLLKPLYEEHKEWESEIKAMLSSKKAQEREIAVQVLTTWGAEQYSQELLTAMEKEKSKKVKEYLKSALHTIKSIQISESTEANKLGQGNKDISEEVKKQALIAEILKGGRKRAVAWVYDNDKIPFPNVHTVEGVAVSEDYMKAILIAYADMSKLGINADAVELAKDLDSNELSEYMLLVWSRWLELRADTKKKWVLYATAIHGGEAIIPVIYKQIQEWPKHSRGAIAEVAIKALALNGSSMALLQINELASKSKYRQVRMAADDAFEYAAEQFGITRGELEDRIVPNFGFNQDRERVFDYGTRTFTVSLTSALELVVTDQKGKQLKNLPAPGKKDDERKAKAAHAEYKQLKKQLETVIKTQKVRLERIFATQRLWQADKWKELFVNNPIMHQFAIGLVWGRYEEEQLQETFRYMEDGSFNTVDEDEYEFPEIGMIGLVHPIELSEEDLEAWKEQLSDYEITQPISQLERPIYELSEEEKMQKELTRYQGENVAYYSMMKLLEMGWSMGEIYDGGITDIFYRRDGKFAVQLNSLGLAVRYGYMDSYVTIDTVEFYPSEIQVACRLFDEIKAKHGYTLSDIPPRYMSEVILHIAKILKEDKA